MSGVGTSATNIFLRHQRLFAIPAIVTAVVLLLLSLLPLTIRIGATSWLEDHGVHQVEIDNVDLNLFAGSFAIEGFSADDGLKAGRLEVNIDWWPILDRRIFIRSVELKNFKVDVHQRDDGKWQVSTIQLAAAAPDTPKPEQTEAAGKPWQVVLNDIDVADVSLKATGKIDRKLFDVSLLLNSLNVSLLKSESDGGQWLKNRIEFGRMTFNGLGYAVKHRSLQLDGTLFLPAMGSDIIAGLKIEGMNLKQGGFSLVDSRQNVRLVAVDAMQLDKGTVEGGSRAAFDLLSLQGVALPTSGDNSLGTVGKVSLQGGKLDFSGTYRLKKVAVHELQASIKRLKEGKFLVLDQLQGNTDTGRVPPEGASGKEGPAAGAVKNPVVHITEFLVGAGSSLTYRDESLSHPFDTKVAVEKLTVTPVDSSGNEKGNLDAVLKVNKNASLTVRGEIIPNVRAPFTNLKIALHNFDMHRLSGFVEPDFGQAIKTGQFDVNSDLKIADNKIDAKNRLSIRKLALESSPESGIASQSLGMPVDMALDLLRDNRGDISLDVPITGRLDNPDIDTNDVIRQALMSAMSKGALSYAKNLLQPYGTMFTVAELAIGFAKSAAKPRLTPIVFNERSSDLGPEMSDYALKISTLMKKKNLRLQLCGVATRIEGGGVTPDRPRIMNDEQLLSLAETRSDEVLKSIQDQGVATDRLYNCRPSIDEKPDKALPRVELILD